MFRHMPAPRSRTAEVMEQFPAQRPAFIRTLAPFVAGPIAAYLVKRGFNIDEAEVLTWMIPVFGYGYYVLVKIIEMYFPKFGWLLGSAKQPSYSPDQTGYQIEEVAGAPEGYEVAVEADPGQADEAPGDDPAAGASLLDMKHLAMTHCLSVHRGAICRLLKHGDDVPHDRVEIN